MWKACYCSNSDFIKSVDPFCSNGNRPPDPVVIDVQTELKTTSMLRRTSSTALLMGLYALLVAFALMAISNPV